jgi:hypothetical protein
MALGLLRLQYTRHKKIAAAIRAGASRDLFYAKERRLAEVGRMLRPMFWATREHRRRERRGHVTNSPDDGQRDAHSSADPREPGKGAPGDPRDSRGPRGVSTAVPCVAH